MKKNKNLLAALGLLFLIACNVDTNSLKGTYHGMMVYSDTAYSGANDTTLATVDIWDSKNPNEINLACSFDSNYIVVMNVGVWCNEPEYIHLGGSSLGSHVPVVGFIANNDSLNYGIRLYEPFELYGQFAGSK